MSYRFKNDILPYYGTFGLTTVYIKSKPLLDKYIKSLTLNDIKTPIIIILYIAPSKPDITKNYGTDITIFNFNVFRSYMISPEMSFINKLLFSI